MNDHTQLLEELATAIQAVDRAQAYAYAQSQLAGESGRHEDMPDYGSVFAALVMARLELDHAFGPAIDIVARGAKLEV